MSLPDLVARLEADAAARVAAIRQQAEGEAAAVRAAAARAVAGDTAAALARDRAARRAANTRRLATARREARAEALTAAHALLSRVLERARALVPEVADADAYQAALPGRLGEALSCLPEGAARVRCAPVHRAGLAGAAAARPQTTLVEDPTLASGFVVEAGDGSVTVDGTLEAGLDAVAPAVALEILREVGDGRA